MPPDHDILTLYREKNPESAEPAVSRASEATEEDEYDVWLQRHREKKRRARKRPRLNSKLAPYRRDIVNLHRKGASLRDIQGWLKSKKRLSVHHSTIADFLKKLPELRNDQAQ